ncbi:hypothetical protein Tco_0456475 [Tanacetum coccineum]
MFSMTSLGAHVDESINNGRGPENSSLLQDIVEGLIDLLDSHNELVQLFRTAHEKLEDTHVPDFRVQLYNVVGAREYELPTGDMLGAIVEDGYSKELKLLGTTGSSSEQKRITMKAYYSYYLHDCCFIPLNSKKRGFPHYHTLIWIDESTRIRKDEDIDVYISAEVPSKDMDPECYGIISELMMHGPCGSANPSALWTDHVVACISRNITSAAATTSRPQIVIDEIKNFLDARSISPHEAHWRIFEFEIHYREPAVQILVVHLHKMQRVIFKERDMLESVVNTYTKKTTLQNGYTTVNTILMEDTILT